MKVRDRIIAAAHALSAEQPVQEISLAALARASGTSWPTVSRHVGGRAGLTRFLEAVGAVAPTKSAGGKPGSEAAEAADTRSRILQAAFRTFAEHGYSGATLDDVAADAGLTKGAVYWHFAGKDDLFMALLEARFRGEGIRVPSHVQEVFASGGGEQAVVAFMVHEVEQARAAEQSRRLGFEFMSRSRNPALRRRYAELARRIHAETIPVAEGLIEDGVVARDLDPKALAFAWRCLLLGLGLWMSQDPEGVDFDAMAPGLAHVMWRGMRPETDDGRGGADDAAARNSG